MANVVYDIEGKLPRLTKTITSKPLSVEGPVREELGFWHGKNENSSGAHSRLSRYWDHIRFGSWSASGTPWSAAFISYVLGQADRNFKGAASHYKYIENVIEGRSPGWEAFSIPKNIGKLKIQPGDILVKARSGDKYSTHGDLVASVKGMKAALVGGNVGNTAKQVGTLSLYPNGTIREGGNYQVLLKKNPVSTVQYGWSRVLAYGGFAAAFGLTGVLAFMVAKRKGLIGSWQPPKGE